ncbi:MAG: DUF362 domain-containing protein [Bryobacteraceae bacterium]|nr:DUF362 domain-containing protein [Bryobacteraceae bacterium]
MLHTRRELLGAALGAVAYSRTAKAAVGKLGIPGPYPGRVVSVRHDGSLAGILYEPEAIRQMMHKGMMELTGAPSWAEAWRVFIQPGDVVGIKVNPVGGRKLSSDRSVLHLIVDGIRQAGVQPKDIVVYDRYRRQLMGARIHEWLPEGVRWTAAVEDYDEVQLGIDGYDPDVYMEIPLMKPGQDPRDAHVRRSYVARFLTKEVNKLVNLPVLKHHSSAGVTLALKNLSHGLVNNVNRSHVSRRLNACDVFIPAVVDTPVIRDKTVLHILDGVKGGYHDGPGVSPKYVFQHKTMYFATDPVALDKTGWRAIDAKRAEAGMPPVDRPAPGDKPDSFLGQPEHIEFASALGLGLFDDAKIELRKFDLS